jgi:hypothetical protein
MPNHLGGVGSSLLGSLRAFSVGFGGLQYDTLVEMQEKCVGGVSYGWGRGRLTD